MEDRQLAWMPKQTENPEAFFRAIKPEDYARLGIDPQDVPVGTFAAQDHPTFLPSRFGGNAYGLGLVEQSVLSKTDTDFLEQVDFQDADQLKRHARQLNAINQKLGLLIRFALTGNRYFLIPINLVAHSLQDIKTKADEIEQVVNQHILQARSERLDIGLLTAANDLIVHELTARFSSHRIFLFDSLERLRSWRTALDIIILPKDLFEYLLEQQLPKTLKKGLSRQRLLNYALYALGKVHDLLEADGKFVLVANAPCPQSDQTYTVSFKTDLENKRFLIFTHILKTKKPYPALVESQEIHSVDLYHYLSRFPFAGPYLKRLLGDRKVGELSLREIDQLPFLNIRPPQPFVKNAEKQLGQSLAVFFRTVASHRKAPENYLRYWQDRLEIHPAIPENITFFVGAPIQPAITLQTLEQDARESGMMGCSLPLVAEYRNSFRYVLDVLQVLLQIEKRDFPTLQELERNRLSNPFEWRLHQYEGFNAILRLMRQVSKLEKLRETLDPDHSEGRHTPMLENLSKLSLHGFSHAQLLEILLIVVGHTTMSRIVFGKLPAKTLKPITDKAQQHNHREIVDLLRICRLMSMAELAAALGPAFTPEQARELFLLYDDAIRVATDPALNWEKLHDLRISALGGVQNRAIREMMKFFNLFDFLDNWQELKSKGPFQREVLCDYNPQKLHHLQEVLELSETAGQFQQQYSADHLSRQSYFFRQFLESEFHGTGHLFPKLGTRAGFILLWITVNAAERHIINFNPMLSRVPPNRREPRLAKIKDALLRIATERLQPESFDELKQSLADNDYAFVFDSGLRLSTNMRTKAVDITFVDIEENLQQLETLMTYLETQKLRGISLRTLQDMESLFSELQSFHQYLNQKECTLHCDRLSDPEKLAAKDREILKIETRLRRIFLSQIFIPEEIHDSLTLLAAYCPDILGFVLPEFHAFGNLVEVWPTRQKQSLGAYVMRCLQKFQALIAKDRSTFQDSTLLYQLAKQEFGPLAEESIGASHAQLEMLENLVDRIQQRPMLYEVFTLALLFQDIGKIERYSRDFAMHRHYLKHAEQGAFILEQSGALDKYNPDPRVQQLVLQLIRHHGLIGHVLQGEEPITILEKLTEERDDRLLDAFVLHAILATAAVEEGLLAADLLDAFLSYRARALEIIKSNSDWTTWLREALREKGQALLAESAHLQNPELQGFPMEPANYCDMADRAEVTDEALWRGRQIAALERLLRLMNAPWVDYQDVQMHLLQTPIAFIYHKKKLKSIGLGTFETQLARGAKVLQAVALLPPEIRYYLLYCLDHLGGRMRVYDFYPLTRFLEVEESLKLLLLAFRSFHRHFGVQVREGLVSFRSLSQHIEHRQADLQGMLHDIPTMDCCADLDREPSGTDDSAGIYFQASNVEQALKVSFKYPVELDSMVAYLEHLWTYETLRKHFHTMTQELQKLPYYAHDYENHLQKAFKRQRIRINHRILKLWQERLNRVRDFSELEEAQQELQENQAQFSFSEEQKVLLKDLLENSRNRVRDQYLDAITQRLQVCDSPEALIAYWNEIKGELFAHRMVVGKEYESLIAGFIDQKMANEVSS
jgi:hypothetical protein